MKHGWRLKLFTIVSSLIGTNVHAYPLDGYQDTGIRRVEGARLANEGVIQGRKLPPGALLNTAQVDLRLLDHKALEIPEPDPEFTAGLLKLVGADAARYGVAVLDLSDADNPRYAQHQENLRQNVGSVGKLIVALGLFEALKDAWPDDIVKRHAVLTNTLVTADEFSQRDHHKISIFDVENHKLSSRIMQIGDQGTLIEFLDWTLSASSNAAAAMTMREAMLLRQYGNAYPPSEDEIQRFFNDTPGKELTNLFQRTFFEPVRRNGLDPKQFRQGSFFTRQGKVKVNGGGGSYATPRQLMLFTLRMEQGRLVDEFSSRLMKRLLYMTERRIRYASSPVLKYAAVYFKSGSLYSCHDEDGFTCRAYAGNTKNFMTSTAIIESPAGESQLHYISTLLSNVLRRNSAIEHQTMGTRIHQLIEKANSKPEIQSGLE